MAYVNTGVKRYKTLTVTRKKADGTVAAGYPKTYNITSAFTANGTPYQSISDSNFAKLTDVAYNARLNAFKAYVEGLNSGLSDSTDIRNGSNVIDTVSCPIGS